jgi:site-specific DNA-adenine methylase
MEIMLGLKPFFSFYGGKWRNTPKYYPAPYHSSIIEPFSGSAGYSLRYPNLDITLIDKDTKISSLWDYLIRVSSSEILKLPDIKNHQTVDDLKISPEAKILLGFWLNRGAPGPRKRPSSWMLKGNRPGSFWGGRVRNIIAKQVNEIRHWKIIDSSYDLADTQGVHTWFIDPPYFNAGKHYVCGSEDIDYEALGNWCKSRLGQVIVCENVGAKWLPFKEIGNIKTTRPGKRSREAMWENTKFIKTNKEQ